MAEPEQVAQGDEVVLYVSLPLTDEDQVVRRAEPARFRDGADERVDWTNKGHRERAVAQGINPPEDPPAREAKVVYYNTKTGAKREEKISQAAQLAIQGWLQAGRRRVPIDPAAVAPGDPPYVEVPFGPADIGRLPLSVYTGKAADLKPLYVPGGPETDAPPAAPRGAQATEEVRT